MKCSCSRNVGGADRIARIILGLALLAYAVLAPAEAPFKLLGFIGIVPLLTGIFRFCPAYLPFKLSTCKKP